MKPLNEIFIQNSHYSVISLRNDMLNISLWCVDFTFHFVGCGAGCFLSLVYLRRCPPESHRPVAPKPPAAFQSACTLTPELMLVEQREQQIKLLYSFEICKHTSKLYISSIDLCIAMQSFRDHTVGHGILKRVCKSARMVYYFQ